jgi:hypothetical protein
MAEYRVRVGKFRVYVKIINLTVSAKMNGKSFYSGAFGIILEKTVAT